MTGVKLRSNTSTIVDGRVYYIVKKFADGKASSLYAAFDFKTGITCGWNNDKDKLIGWLNEHSQAIEDKFKEVTT